MLSGHFVAFDDFIKSTDTVFTPADLDDNLGRHDQMAIQCVVTNQNNASATAAIRIQIWHSNDGRHFLPKYTDTDGEISEAGNVPSTGVVVLQGFDEGTTPSFRFVRLGITLVDPCTSAHVKVLVATRDQGR